MTPEPPEAVEEANAVGRWLGASNAPVDVIATQERVSEALAVLERRLAEKDEALRKIATYVPGKRNWLAAEHRVIAREALRAEPAKRET